MTANLVAPRTRSSLCWRIVLLLLLTVSLVVPLSALAAGKSPGRQISDLNALEDRAHAKAAKAQKAADKLGDQLDKVDQHSVSQKQWEKALEKYDELAEEASEAQSELDSAHDAAKAARDKWADDTAAERAEHESALENPNIDPCNRALSEAYLKAHGARENANKLRDELDELDKKAEDAVDEANKALEEYEKREGQDRRVQEGTLRGRMSDAKSALKNAKEQRRNSKKLDRRANSLEKAAERARTKAARSKICNPDAKPDSQTAIGSDANPVATTLDTEHKTLIYLGENINPQDFINQHGLTGAHVLSAPSGIANGIGSMISVADTPGLQAACAANGTECESDHCQEFLLPDESEDGVEDPDDIPDFSEDDMYTEEELAEIEEENREIEEARNSGQFFGGVEDDEKEEEGDVDTPTASISSGNWIVMAGTGWSKAETPLDPATTGGQPATSGGQPGTMPPPGGTPGTTPGGTPGTTPGGTPGTTPGGTPGTTPGGTPSTTGGQPGEIADGSDPSTPISVNPEDFEDDTFDEMDDALAGGDGDPSSIDEDENGDPADTTDTTPGDTISEDKEIALINEIDAHPYGSVERYEAAADFYRFKIEQAQTGQTKFPVSEDYINHYRDMLDETLTEIQDLVTSDSPKYYEAEKEIAETQIEESSDYIIGFDEGDPARAVIEEYMREFITQRDEAEAGLVAIEEGKDPDLPFIPIGSTTTTDEEDDEDEPEDGDSPIGSLSTTSIKGNVKTGVGEAVANAVIVLFPQGPSVAQALDDNPDNDPEWDDGPLVKTKTGADGSYDVNVEPSTTKGQNGQASATGSPSGTAATPKPTDKKMASVGPQQPASTPAAPVPVPVAGAPKATPNAAADPFSNAPNVPTKAYEPTQQQRIEKYIRSRVSLALNDDPKAQAGVEAAYKQKKNPSELPTVTYVKALSEVVPNWMERYPDLLSSMLGTTESRRYLLRNYAANIPEKVLRRHHGVMIEYIRTVTEADDASLWGLVDVHWINNWRADVPDSVTVLEGLERWRSDWISKYPELLNVFLANPDTKDLIVERLAKLRDDELAELRGALDNYVRNNASAIDDVAKIQEEQVWGALLVQRQHIQNLIKFRSMLTRYKSMTVQQKASFINNMSSKAEELFNARASMVYAKRRASTVVKSNLNGRWLVSDNGLWQREYEKLIKQGKRKEAAESRWGEYLAAQNNYVKLLDQNPVLALKPDEWIKNRFLFDYMWREKSSADSAADIAAKFDTYLDANIALTNSEIADVTEIDEWDDLEEFGTPRYRRAQQQVVNRMNGAGYLAGSAWVNVLIGDQDLQAAEAIMYNLILEGALTLVSLVPLVIPVAAPLAIAADVILVSFSGGELVVTLYDEDQAEDFAGVTGHRYHMSAKDKVAAATGKFAFTSLTIVPLGFHAVGKMRVVNKTKPRSPVIAGGGRAATSGDDALRVLKTTDDIASSSSSGFKISGASDDVNELASAAAREGVPPAEIQAIVKRYVDDVTQELEPAVFNRMHNELTIAAANAKDLTIVVQKGIGGRLPGERYLFDLDELVDMAGGTRPRNPVKETDLVLWQLINAKTATRPKKPGLNASQADVRTYEIELKSWESGWTQEMVSYVENGVLVRTDDQLLRMWEFNPYESVGSRFFDPNQAAGLAKMFTPDDLARLRSLWKERPPRPVQTAGPPGPGPVQGPAVAPPRPGMDLESTVPGRGPVAVDPPRRASFNPEPPAPAVMGGRPADPGVQPLRSADEYAELLKRQTDGEILDLTELPRPGIAGVVDGQVGVVQGAGRFEKLKAGESADVFIPEGTKLPPGVTVVERGISGDTAFTINMLSSRGPSGANPTLLGPITRGKTYMRVTVPRRLIRAPTSRVGLEVGELSDELRAWAKKRGPDDPLGRRVETMLESQAFRDKSLVEQAEALNALNDVLKGNPLATAPVPAAAPAPATRASSPSAPTPVPTPKPSKTLAEIIEEASARSDARNMRDSIKGGESYVPVENLQHYTGDKAVGDVVEVGHVVDDHYARNAGPGKLYESSTVPPTHTTNRSGLQGIRNDPEGLTRDLAGNASWSYEGTLRGGDVVIRLNTEGQRFVKIQPVTGVGKGHGQVPEFFPQGLDSAGKGIGPSRANVPARFLEYYSYFADRWLPVGP